MKNWMFGVVSVLAAAGCVRLGLWQLDRLATRRAENAVIESRLAEPGITLAELAGWPPESLAYRQVQVSGRYDGDRPVVEVFRTRNGVPGAYLVVPLLVAPDTAVLIERGWAPAADARSIDISAFAITDSVTVSGYVRPLPGPEPPGAGDAAFPRYVRTANPGSVALAVPYTLLPNVVRRAGGFEPGDLALIGLPVLSEGSHLSYAVQWFAFAAIALIGGAIWISRQGRAEAAIRY